MVQIKQEEEVEEDDETIEEELEEIENQKAHISTLKKSIKKPITSRINKPKEDPKPANIQKRYQAFNNQALEGVVDIETNEVLATSGYEAFANIIERLERIENTLGQLIEG